MRYLNRALRSSACLAMLPLAATPAFGQFFGPSTGPFMRPLGGPLVVNRTNRATPFFIVNPGGPTLGYLAPNGAFVVPSQPAPAASANAMIAPGGAAAFFAPFSGLAGSENPQAAMEATQVQGQTYNGNLYGSTAIPRTSETIDARIDKDNRLDIRWSGEPRAVTRIRFALLDKNKSPIKEQVITRLPAAARLAITSKTSYYEVQVTYLNGTTTSVISPL